MGRKAYVVSPSLPTNYVGAISPPWSSIRISLRHEQVPELWNIRWWSLWPWESPKPRLCLLMKMFSWGSLGYRKKVQLINISQQVPADFTYFYLSAFSFKSNVEQGKSKLNLLSVLLIGCRGKGPFPICPMSLWSKWAGPYTQRLSRLFDSPSSKWTGPYTRYYVK